MLAAATYLVIVAFQVVLVPLVQPALHHHLINIGSSHARLTEGRRHRSLLLRCVLLGKLKRPFGSKQVFVSQLRYSLLMQLIVLKILLCCTLFATAFNSRSSVAFAPSVKIASTCCQTRRLSMTKAAQTQVCSHVKGYANQRI